MRFGARSTGTAPPPRTLPQLLLPPLLLLLLLRLHPSPSSPREYRTDAVVPAVVSWALFAVAQKTSSGLAPYDPVVTSGIAAAAYFLACVCAAAAAAAALLALAFRYYVCRSLQPPPAAQTQTPFRTPRLPLTLHAPANHLPPHRPLSCPPICDVCEPGYLRS